MVDHRTRPHQPRGLLLVLLAACLVAALPLLLYRSAAATSKEQAKALDELRKALADAQEDRDVARKELQSARSELGDLEKGLTARAQEMRELTDDIKFDLDKHRRQFSPADKISEQPASAIVRIDSKGQFVASPSIVKLPSGRLLVALERSVTWGQTKETTMKLIYSSDDGGSSWQRAAGVGPMNWPQIFSCASGVYLMGTERHFSKDNNLVISKMLDDKGASWSAPTRLTKTSSVVSANNGVDVSYGRVTKAFEVIPSMSVPLLATRLTQETRVEVQGGVGGPTWQYAPFVDLHVASTDGFVAFTLVKVPLGSRAVFFRIAEILPAENVIRARLERFNLFWQNVSVTLPVNSTLSFASSAHIYGGVDWVAMAMSADETADLRDPASWTLSPGVGNPASLYSNEMRELFDAAFRGDAEVRKSIIGFDVPGLDTSSAWEAGFGSLYWMEGVLTRQRDRRGANGKLLSIMRVNNDVLCDLAALVEFDDATLRPAGTGIGAAGANGTSGQLVGRFLRYTFVPGLGVGHPAILYDEESDLYWMVTNFNRDANRNWKQPAKEDGTHPNLHITAFSKCEVDRSTLALYYSSNLVSWMLAGMVDYHLNLGRHFAYPHMLIDGRDLLVVTRAAFAPWAKDADAPLNSYYNNHNSNTVAFHRVRNFRHYANIEWAAFEGQYSKHPRRTSMKDEVEQAEGGTSFTKEVAKRQAAEAAAAAADAAARGGAEQQQQQPPRPAEQKAQPQAAGQPKEEQQKPPAAEVAAGDANQRQQQQQGAKQPAPPAGQPALQAPAGEEGYEDQPYR